MNVQDRVRRGASQAEMEIEGGIVDGVEIDWFDMWVSVPGLTCCGGSIFGVWLFGCCATCVGFFW